MLERIAVASITGAAKILTGAQCQWIGCGPRDAQRIYFANHSSHLDFVLLWSALPPALRKSTRPVAAADYWFQGTIRRFLMRQVFHAVPVERDTGRNGAGTHLLQPVSLQPMLDALDEGSSLIIFPEGTRGSGEEVQPFRSGIFHLAKDRPDVELVPVWIENCYRVMPKGSLLPVPLVCTVRFGTPTKLGREERRPDFLDRLKKAVEELRNL
jgi:1-acyl-sn-glycerol-3-phosphate acyltransferase